MADSASVVSAQISVARSEAHSLAAPSVAHSEPGLRAPSSRRNNVDGRRRQLPKKSHSTTSLDSNEKKEERRRVAPSAAARSPAAGSSSRRGSLTKSMSLSAMNASGSDHHQHQSSRLLQKSRSRRQIQSTTSSHNGDPGHRSSKSMTHKRKQSRSENLMNDSSNREEEKTVASTSASHNRRRTTSAEMGNSSNRDKQRRPRPSKNANTDEEKSRRSRSKSVRRKSDRSTKRSSETSASLASASADRDAPKKEKRSSKSDALKSPSSSHGKPQSQHRSSVRKSSARPSAEGEETRSTPVHRSRPRSVSAGPSTSRRKSNSVKPRISNSRTPRASETPMSSLSENTHRGRLSSPQRGTPGKSMHQSIGAINTDLPIMKQTSRPLPRRELAKKKSVRAPGWLSERGHQSTSIMDHSNATEGGGRGRRGTRAIQEHDLLQMSVSELNHDVQVIPSDPLTLSPTSANTDPQRIYELGLLSPAHLDRQPSANAAAPVVAAPKEIVKVQFVQSGGKVVPVKSPKDHLPADPSATPRSTAKKKLQNLLAFGMTPKLKASSLFSRYQTFRDDDHSGHQRSSPAEDSTSPSSPNSNATLDPKISSWSEVDAAIPMLHL